MDKRTNGLWQGGAWEHPERELPDPPAVRIPEPAPRRPVLRVRQRRRRWPRYVGLLALILAVCVSVGLLERYFK